MHHKPFIFATLLSLIALAGASLSCTKPKQVEAEATTHYAAANQYFIVDVHDVSSWWYNDGDHTYIDFVYNDVHTVYDTERVDNNLDAWYIKPTSAIPYNFIIIVRGADGFATGPDWGKKHNQTLDLYPPIDSPSAIYVQNYKEWGDNEDSYRATFGGDEILANEYARYFLTKDLCKDEGGLASYASITWSGLRSIYRDHVSGRFTTSSYLTNYVLEDGDASNIGNMLRRYETLLRKNSGFNNFMSRDLTQKQQGIAGIYGNSSLQNNNQMLLYIIIAIATIATASTFFLSAKRKSE